MTDPAPAPDADLGDLLDFDPVPRKRHRVDGWHAEAQRAFVHALALTGSRRRAAAAVGKSQFGVDQLLRAPGSTSFRAACDAAMAIAAERSAGRLATGLEAVAAESAAWAPAAGPWSGARTRRPPAGRSRPGDSRPAPAPAPAPDEQETPERKARQFAGIVRDYLIKVGQEREARLRGEITAADYYLRQLTFIEVMLDLTGPGGLFKTLADFREGGYHLVDIAQTPMSKLLGDARRAKWAELGEPPRPPHPPQDLLVARGRVDVEPTECTRGGLEASHADQRAAFKARYARDAEKQLEWEARARRDFENRRDGAT